MGVHKVRNSEPGILPVLFAFLITLAVFIELPVWPGCNMAYADTSEFGGTLAVAPYANPDSNGDGYGDNIAFSVPSQICFAVNSDGTLLGPSHATIQNLGSAAIHVSSVKVSGANGFSFVPDAANAPEQNAVGLAFGVKGDMLDSDRYTSKARVGDEDAWSMGGGGTLDLLFEGRVSNLTADIASAKSFGSIEWYVQEHVVNPTDGGAYAVLDSEGKLTLFRSKSAYESGADQTVTDIMGNTYAGYVYTGVENTPESFTGAPWRSQRDQVRSVDVADGQIIVPASTAGWFYECTNLTQCDLYGLDTSTVGWMNLMFGSCSSLTSIDLGFLDTSSATMLTGLFKGCSGLTSIDVSHLDTSNVTILNTMFSGCTSLTSLDLSNFETSNVVNFGSMFSGCTRLESIDMSSFDTSNATAMDSMFRNCNSLKTLDVSNFDVSKVENANGLFYFCTSLTTIYAAPDADWSSNFGPRDSYYRDIFTKCGCLVGGQGTNYNDLMYGGGLDTTRGLARVDGLGGRPGFFTAKEV